MSQLASLLVDNLSAHLLARNPVHNSNMKHIDVRHHFIRECVANDSIVLRSISSADNIAASDIGNHLERSNFPLALRDDGYHTLGDGRYPTYIR